jgi:hypothetical protein
MGIGGLILAAPLLFLVSYHRPRQSAQDFSQEDGWLPTAPKGRGKNSKIPEDEYWDNGSLYVVVWVVVISPWVC